MATTTQELQTTKTTLPPGPRPLPYIGNTLSLRQDPLGFLQQLQRTYGNMATIYGAKHRQQRHAVQPAFHKKRVEGYAAIMEQYTQELLKTWHPGDTVDMSRTMQELTLHIVSKCLFSIDLSSQLGPLSDD